MVADYCVKSAARWINLHRSVASLHWSRHISRRSTGSMKRTKRWRNPPTSGCLALANAGHWFSPEDFHQYRPLSSGEMPPLYWVEVLRRPLILNAPFAIIGRRGKMDWKEAQWMGDATASCRLQTIRASSLPADACLPSSQESKGVNHSPPEAMAAACIQSLSIPMCVAYTRQFTDSLSNTVCFCERVRRMA